MCVCACVGTCVRERNVRRNRLDESLSCHVLKWCLLVLSEGSLVSVTCVLAIVDMVSHITQQSLHNSAAAC